MTLTVSKKLNVNEQQSLLYLQSRRDSYKTKCLISSQISITILILVMIGSFYLLVYPKIKQMTIISVYNHNNTDLNENMVTLYAYDTLASTFNFGEGKYGQFIVNWVARNGRQDIDFNNYNKGNFTVGIQGTEVGTIIDLGTSDDLQRKYQYQESFGKGEAFASIHLQNRTLVILKDIQQNTFQPMEESAELFRQGTPIASVTINYRHIYVFRTTDPTRPNFERIVKILVIAYQPYQWVTIRWGLLV